MKEQTVIGTWLKEQMAKAGLTATELSQRSTVSRASIYFYLDGTRIPSKKYVEMMCIGMRIDPDTAPDYEMRPEGKKAHKI